MKKETHRRSNLQKGATDLALIMSFFALFISVGAAIIYFSLFGDSRPINALQIFQGAFTSGSAIKTYSAHIRVQPEGTSPTIPMFEGEAFFDVMDSKTSATFNIPVSLEKDAPMVAVTALFSGKNKFMKFHAQGGGTVFPDEWFLVSPEDLPPKQFDQIEKTNSLLDVMEVFRKGKPYVTVDGEISKEKIGGMEEVHFALRAIPSKTLPPEISEKIAMLIREGKLNIWAEQKNGDPKEIRFSLEGYTVTVSITGKNKVSDISVPKTFLSQKEWKEKQFALSLPAEAIIEVLIGSYGDIKKEYLEGVKSAVQKATGVKVTVMGSGASLSKKAPLYNAERQQFDADALFRSIQAASAKYGNKSRFIYVFDVDLYSPASPDRASVWFAAKPGMNASLISIYGLSKKSDSAETPVASSLVVGRLQKISLHVLGASVGFSQSSSADNIKCLMYPATTLAELDGQGSGYCSPEKGTVSRIFQK